jgi:DNA-binding CsgD family transcriptional regulator
MAASDPVKQGGELSERVQFSVLFESLTSKQHEVFELVAENWTSKEIAARLGVTESAINQRIEAVRLRTGFLPRSHVARAYRQFRAERAALSATVDTSVQNASASDGQARFKRGDARMPERFIGSNGGLNRVAAMVFIAAGLMMVAMASLALAQVLPSL